MADESAIFAEVRPRLEAAFGRRFRGVLLYGSRARADAAPDSDLDLLVLLDGPIDVARDVGTITDALYPLQLKLDYCIHASPADFRDFEAQEFSLYRNVKREGVPV